MRKLFASFLAVEILFTQIYGTTVFATDIDFNDQILEEIYDAEELVLEDVGEETSETETLLSTEENSIPDEAIISDQEIETIGTNTLADIDSFNDEIYISVEESEENIETEYETVDMADGSGSDSISEADDILSNSISEDELGDEIWLSSTMEEDDMAIEEEWESGDLIDEELSAEIPSAASTEEAHLSDKELVAFGSYPQSRICNATVISELSTLEVDSNNDVVWNGRRYRKYVSDDTENWYEYEPIEWYVMAKSGGRAFLLSKEILDANWHASEWVITTWEDSLAREWLRTDFYEKAFTEAEQAGIHTTSVSNTDGNTTSDKIYLMSSEEINTYDYGFYQDSDRLVDQTDYAAARGALQCYLLRDTLDTLSLFYLGLTRGIYGWQGTILSTVPTDAWWGIRPCMWVDYDLCTQTGIDSYNILVQWDDEENLEGNRPSSVDVTVYGENENTVITVTEGDNWQSSVIAGNDAVISNIDAAEVSGYTAYVNILNQTDVVITYIKDKISFAEPKEYHGKFYFRSELKKDSSLWYEYKYDDKWFESSSYNYQHDLTRMSIKVALAAFGTYDNEQNISTDTNIKKLMEDLEFTYAAEYSEYTEPTGYDTIGSAIGYKNIVGTDGEKYSLVLVTVRGAGYGQEWGGNFKVGTGQLHDGFNIAANTVLTRTKAFLEDNKDVMFPRVKIWICGYSRAAAVTNLIASKIDQGQIAGIDAEDTYAFCFECPSTVRNQSEAKRLVFKNIVNVVNPADVVPLMPLSQWKYTRYGATYYIPWGTTIDSNSKYKRLIDDMTAYYSHIGDVNEVDILVKNTTGGYILAEEWILLTNELADISPTADFYAWFLQDTMVPLAAKKMDSIDLLSAVKSLAVVALEIAYKVQQAKADWVYAAKLLAKISAGGIIVLNAAATKSHEYAHYPELCLSWLEAIEGQTGFGSDKYKMIFVNCPVDVEIYGSGNELVGSIVDNTANQIEGGIYTIVDENDQKIMVLPDDDTYTIKMTATDAGEVTYTVLGASLEDSSDSSLVSYYEMEVEKGDVITSTVSPEENAASATVVTNQEGNVVQPSVTQSGSEVTKYEIYAVVDGEGGTVSGGGYCNAGEYVKLIATPDDGYVFAGWYADGNQVSADQEYRVLVKETKTYSARFNSTSKDETEPSTTPSETYNPKFNYKSLKLQYKQKFSGLKVSGLNVGDKVVSWKSSNTKIVKVSKTGKLTAKSKKGTATITAKLASGKTVSCKVKVQKKKITTKKITGLKKKVTLKKGKTLTLKPVLSPITSTSGITYSSSKKSVAVVSKKGKIKAKKKGTTKITVKSGKVKFVVTVKVK